MNKLFFLPVLLLFFALGCQENKEIVSGLSSKESIEILVRLGEIGLSTKRVKAGGANSSYRIEVASEDYSKAIKTLHELGLPRASKDDLGALTKPGGLVPNPAKLSSLRLDYALGLEIERLLGALPGVTEARVVVRSNLVPKNTGDSAGEPTASVVIRYLSRTGKFSLSEEKVKKLVSRAVPGLRTERVLVETNQVFLPAGSRSIAVGEKGETQALRTLWPFGIEVSDKGYSEAVYKLAFSGLGFIVIGMLMGSIGFFSLSKSKGTRGVGHNRQQLGNKTGNFLN